MPDARISLEVFYAYAPKDEPYCQELDKHLSILKRQGLISTWHPRLILAGANWSQDIDAHLNQAAVILLLISADFLASDYCYSIELQQALERHQAGEVRVIPILLRSVDWKGASFAHLQPLPIDGRFITQWEDLDTAFTEVAAGIRRAIEDQAQLTIRLPNSAFPPFWNVPLARNPFFLDREDLLTQLHVQLQGNQSATFSQKQALSGLGGIGKTQLAVEYAYRYCESYRAVLWARAENPDTLNASYSELAVLLNLPEQQAQEQGVIVQAVKHWFQTQNPRDAQRDESKRTMGGISETKGGILVKQAQM